MAHPQIYVNLPVEDLDRSVRFFTALGFAFNPVFTNENATCMIVGDDIFVMLLVKPYFQTFTTKRVCERDRIEVIVCLSQDSRAAIDAMVERARAAGGRVPGDPVDHGFMYQHAFEDPDGHLWELVHMDAAPPA
ncbi:VOC family protein [Luteimonas sp. BDR2-5]|uniref:VOC family protein n=1 Tax=Proluteimonas luteida TaxID=2878685 RepID=UPI001E37C173|nr:VOC family protein [Luteimonas sp. BDR2-5]MCD9028040.1 VOC family protein [Luteimonas sp. BDR2-5]